jgi:hypothetical protein
MTQGWALNIANRTAVQIDFKSLGAQGLFSPRLLIWMNFETPNERITVDLHDLRIRVKSGQEYLGETRLTGEHVTSNGLNLQLDVPTTHRMLNYVTDHLGSQEHIALTLGWYGLIRFFWNPNEADSRYMGEPAPGEWTDFQIDEGSHEQQISIARSEWFSRVVSVVGTADYVFTEVAVPKEPLGDQWRSALVLLDKAEKAFTLGDDASVFSHLLGVLNALPGAKQMIFNDLPKPQQSYVDELTKSIVAFLHSGRHVSDLANGEVGFPVDHVDARFAINLVRTLLSYASISIDAAQKRANK